MDRTASYKLVLLLISIVLAVPASAQVPTGTITGTVTDASGAVLPKAKVTVTNKDTGATRTLTTNGEGIFAAPSLPAGTYEVRLESPGFQVMVRQAEVTTGQTTTINAAMQVGATKEVVTIADTGANLNIETNTVQGVVSRPQIDNLPLNGRSFLNLAQLEPGVTVGLGNPAQFNSQFNVSVLGGPASHTAITVDGGNIRNPVEGGTGQNFSQEVVQEFQISSTNFDLSTGITAFGAINIVTRGGGNDHHGAGYFYFRDHNMSAYPSLKRTSLTDDPFFARRQSGFLLSGPVKKDKLFYFFNLEHSNQTGVYAVQPDLTSVARFGTVSPAPFVGTQLSSRVDYKHSDKHTGFFRFSYDGNRNSGPFTAGIPVPPSNFISNKNYVTQGMLGVTSILSPRVVNDFRFSYFYWQNRNTTAPCTGDPATTCLGAGGPEVFYLNSVNFALGNNFNSPQGRDVRRYPISDNVTWQRGSHRVKFGGEWEHFRGTGYWGFFDPARVYLLSPEYLRGVFSARFAAMGVPPAAIPQAVAQTFAALSLPESVQSMTDLQRLPVVTFILGIGDRAQPSYRLDRARSNDRFHLYAQDTWKVSSNLTLNYGVGWEHENNVLNYDLPKPAFLAPIYGSDTGASQKEYKNFTPAVGFAWSLGKDNKTVIRGGAGLFYDMQLGWWRLGERAALGGSGRQFIGNAAVISPQTGLPLDTAYLNTLAYRYSQFLTELPALRAQLDARFPGTGDQAQMLISKQANDLGALYPREVPTTQAQHFNIGFQRELNNGIVAQADFVYRHMIHGIPGGFFGDSVDFNRFNTVTGPVIPACVGTQAIDPAARCSNGPINFWWPGATSKYKALLVKVEKRFSRRYQLTASYALQSSHSIQDVTQNPYDYFATYGPDLSRHNLNISGIVELPRGFQVSVLSAFSSHPPVAPTISGISNTGNLDSSSGGYTSLLGVMGKGFSDFLSKDDLQDLVNQYNSTVAGTLTPAGRTAIPALAGQRYPAIALPADYQLSDLFSSQDVRITKTFGFTERVKLRLIGEVFNIFNVSNASNFNFDLVTTRDSQGNLLPNPAFGQANQRVGQTFGSGGPRAFQFAARLSF